MKAASFHAIIEALETAKVRYLLAGGLAVNAHGYLRFTKDVDFVFELVSDNILSAWRALGAIGYQPIVPVNAADFADATLRQRMIDEKGMKVLQFYADNHRETPIDVFVSEPFDFTNEYSRALSKPLGSHQIRYVSLETLLAMKRDAGRPQDLADIQQLQLRHPDQP